MSVRIVAAAIAAALFAAVSPLSAGPAGGAGVVAAERITVAVEGRGPDVILVPGLASSPEVWRGIADQLRKTHRLHLVQLAGFAGAPASAESDGPVAAPAAEAIADYIARERLKAPAIIGHSLGGEAALMLAARHPDRVGGVMVVDALPFYSLLLDGNATVETAQPRAAAFRDMLLAAPPEQADAMQAEAIGRLVKNRGARMALIGAGRRSDRRTIANATYELMMTDLRPELSRIQAPVHVVYAWDRAYGVPAADIDRLFGAAYIGLPNRRLTRIDDSFHFIMLDQPAQFAQAVDEFLDADAAVRNRSRYARSAGHRGR